MISEREKFMAIIDGEILKKSDAIIILEGDGENRNEKSAELYRNGWGEKIVFSGGFDDPKSGAYIQKNILDKLISFGVRGEDVIEERNSKNTKEQGDEVMKIVKEKNWKKIILVASNYHQYRAYLTFLKSMENANLLIEIFNAPARLKWFDKNEWGARYEILDLEFDKIDRYKDHLMSYEKAIKYQKWKEKQV